MPLPAIALTGLGALFTYAIASGVAQGVAKAAVSLGVGFVAFQGADLLVTQNSTQILTLLGGLSPLTLSLVGVLKVGVCVKIAFSAMLMRLSVFGLNEGVIKRMRVVGPAA